MSFAMSIFFFVVAYFLPAEVIGFYSKDPLVVEAAARYLRITAWSYPLTSISFAYAIQLRSVNRAALPMWTSSIALMINGFLNWVLIFGNLGMPEMGIEGAALATTVARSIECFVMVSMVYFFRYPLASTLNGLFNIRKTLFLDYLKVSSPVLINEMVWALGLPHIMLSMPEWAPLQLPL